MPGHCTGWPPHCPRRGFPAAAGRPSGSPPRPTKDDTARTRAHVAGHPARRSLQRRPESLGHAITYESGSRLDDEVEGCLRSAPDAREASIVQGLQSIAPRRPEHRGRRAGPRSSSGPHRCAPRAGVKAVQRSAAGFGRPDHHPSARPQALCHVRGSRECRPAQTHRDRTASGPDTGLADVRLHDLLRTVVSLLLELGTPQLKRPDLPGRSSSWSRGSRRRRKPEHADWWWLAEASGDATLARLVATRLLRLAYPTALHDRPSRS